jgi:hypothetical protein
MACKPIGYSVEPLDAQARVSIAREIVVLALEAIFIIFLSHTALLNSRP